MLDMTTVVVTVSDSYITMACDGRVSAGGVKYTDTFCKIRRIGDYLIGFAGTATDCLKLVEWIEGGCEGKQPKCPGADLLIARKDGTVLSCDSGSTPMPIDPPTAIGSGSAHALTALDLGCSAADAVRAAMMRDIHSGGTVTTLRMRRV